MGKMERDLGMDREKQKRAPIYEALEAFKKKRVVPFDVPGHKRGRGNPELVQLLGEKCVSLDVNSMKPLDNLCHPVSVIKEAEELAAEAFGAAGAYLMVGGTTSAVQTMILSVCRAGDKIILPRNVHKSVINAMVLCGAVPVYVNPDVNQKLGISLGMEVDKVRQAIEDNPDAVAVFVNNPTYYGICSDIKTIVELAHARGMKVLADEAHGTHLYFGKNLPVSAMEAGADLAAVSMHKSGGSLTQSSLLLLNKGVNADYVRQIINLTQTTSASYLLLSSLDISRRNLALRGEESFGKVVDMAEYARSEINSIGGYYAYGKELVNGNSVFDYDVTKLSVYTRDIGLAGIEVYDLLRDEYDIQIEFGDISNILAYISIGDRIQDIERLVGALADIERLYKKDSTGLLSGEYISPKVVMSPQKAFYSDKISLPVEKSSGRVCAEFVMCYPPGIPILAPGEMITDDIVEYIMYAKEKGWDKEAGLDIEMKLFNSGPDILNALPAGEWRFAAVGALPAMLGNLRYGTSIIAQANNEAALCTSVVVRADSPIAKVKGWNKDYPEVYGSPETVRGKTFLATTLTSSARGSTSSASRTATSSSRTWTSRRSWARLKTTSATASPSGPRTPSSSRKRAAWSSQATSCTARSPTPSCSSPTPSMPKPIRTWPRSSSACTCAPWIS